MDDPIRTPEYDISGSAAAARPDSAEEESGAARLLARIEVFLDRYLRPGSRDWAAASHLAPMIAYAIPLPFVGILIAWCVWRLKRDSEAGVATHGREALNFQINVSFWSLVALLLLLLPWVIVNICAIALGIVGALHAIDGRDWRYPFIYRVVD